MRGKLRTALQFHGVDVLRQLLWPLFKILVHPVRDLGEAGDPVLRLASSGQAVALAVEEDEAGGDNNMDMIIDAIMIIW